MAIFMRSPLSVWDYFSPILQFLLVTPSPCVPLPLMEGEGGGIEKRGFAPLNIRLFALRYFKETVLPDFLGSGGWIRASEATSVPNRSNITAEQFIIT